jgi:hypothetical protein
MAKVKSQKKGRDERFIEDLYGYLVWAADNDVPVVQQIFNVRHDLHGWYTERHENWWCPRTKDYHTHIRESELDYGDVDRGV